VGEKHSIDAMDRRILLALDHDPDATSVSIARELGLSRNTVQARLRRLQHSDALAAPSVRARAGRLGYPILAFVTLELTQGSPQPLNTYLLGIPELLEVHAVSGDGDLRARVVAKDTDDLFRITQRLLNAPGVVRTRTAIALREVIPLRMGPLLTEGG
jgi:DNA-binding Lrp family transcriptional regulator